MKTDGYVVLVADTDIDHEGYAEPDVIGVFADEEDAIEWAVKEQRYLVQVVKITYREPS